MCAFALFISVVVAVFTGSVAYVAWFFLRSYEVEQQQMRTYDKPTIKFEVIEGGKAVKRSCSK